MLLAALLDTVNLCHLATAIATHRINPLHAFLHNAQVRIIGVLWSHDQVCKTKRHATAAGNSRQQHNGNGAAVYGNECERKSLAGRTRLGHRFKRLRMHACSSYSLRVWLSCVYYMHLYIYKVFLKNSISNVQQQTNKYEQNDTNTNGGRIRKSAWFALEKYE